MLKINFILYVLFLISLCQYGFIKTDLLEPSLQKITNISSEQIKTDGIEEINPTISSEPIMQTQNNKDEITEYLLPLKTLMGEWEVIDVYERLGRTVDKKNYVDLEVFVGYRMYFEMDKYQFEGFSCDVEFVIDEVTFEHLDRLIQNPNISRLHSKLFNERYPELDGLDLTVDDPDIRKELLEKYENFCVRHLTIIYFFKENLSYAPNIPESMIKYIVFLKSDLAFLFTDSNNTLLIQKVL